MSSPPKEKRGRFGIPGRRSTLLNAPRPNLGKKKEIPFHVDLKDLTKHSESVSSARSYQDGDISPENGTFSILVQPETPKRVKGEEKLPKVSKQVQIVHVYSNTHCSMGLNIAQKSLVFSHLDSILSSSQHSAIQEGGPLSISASSRLMTMCEDIRQMVDAQSRVHGVIRVQALVRCWIVRRKYKIVLGLYGDSVIAMNLVDLASEEKQEKVATLKSSWENVNDSNPFPRTSPILVLKMRNDTFNELIKLEKAYISRLQSLVRDYLLPMRKKQMKGVDIGSIAQIFSNVEELLDIHIEISKELESLPGEPYNPFFSGVGDIFLKYSDEILPMYGNYVENYHLGLDTLDELCTSNPKFASFLEDTRTKGNQSDMMSCRDKLGLPLQHLPQWGTMLSQMLQYSSNITENQESLTNSTTIIGKASDLIRMKLDASAANAKLLAIQRRVESDAPLNLVGSNRHLIREGQVAKACDKKNAHLFLFNDSLLITEPAHSNSLKLVARFNIRQDTRMRDISKDKNKFVFSICVDDKETKIFLKNGPEKAAWMADIVTLIHQYQLKRVFGVSLRIVLEAEKREIPLVIERGIADIRERGLDVEGIFRIPGDTTTIKELKTAFDTENGAEIDFSKYTVHDIGGIVKLFFRELPNPLFPFEFFPKLLDIYSMYEDGGLEIEAFLTQVSKLIASLPKENRVLFKYLLCFLTDIAQHSEENKMTPRNIAVVFAPNIIRPKEDTIETALLSPQVSKILEILIEQNNEELWNTVEKFDGNGEKFELEKLATPKLRLVETDSPQVRRSSKREKIKGAVAKRKGMRDIEEKLRNPDAPELLTKQKSPLRNTGPNPKIVTPFTMDDLVKVRDKNLSVSAGPSSARSASPH